MARVLLICDAGDGLLDLGLHAQAAGHQVRYFLRKYDPKTRPVGKGLLDRVADWRSSMDWSDIAILEANGAYMSEMDAWRRRGCVIIGGNAESAAWELDRTKGMEVFRKAGIPVPEFREFNDYDSAIRYVERQGEPMFSKPCSETADKALSAKTGIPEDPTYMLRKWKKKHGRPPCPFLIQEGIKGVEAACGMWFGPAGFVAAVEENFEEKRLYSGGLGPNSGEQGTVMRIVRRSKLAERVLLPCEEQLAATGYIGNIDVNCILDDEGNVWPLEWTVRLGWPAFNIETALFDCDPVEFLYAVATGEALPASARRLNEVAVGVVLATPPYPYPPSAYEDTIGVPIYGEDERFHPVEVQSGEDSTFMTAGHYVGISVGTGRSVRDAARQAYRALGKISMPGSPYWRNDIGARLRRGLDAIQQHGFASGLEY